MKNQIRYFVYYQLFATIYIFDYQIPNKHINIEISLLIISIYILSYAKSLVNTYKQEPNKFKKLYIGFSIVYPIIYICIFILHWTELI